MALHEFGRALVPQVPHEFIGLANHGLVDPAGRFRVSPQPPDQAGEQWQDFRGFESEICAVQSVLLRWFSRSHLVIMPAESPWRIAVTLES
jgi:hypothetical protein